MVVESHEEGVDDDTQRDEELHKGIEHNEADQFLQLDPRPAAVPNTERVHAGRQEDFDLVLHGDLILLILLLFKNCGAHNGI